MGTISYIIEVSIAWTVLYGLFFAFLRKETFFDINRWYLLSSFLFGLTLPFLKHLAIEWLFISNDESVQYTITQIQQLPQYVATSIQPEESWKDLITNALFSIYLAGAIIIFGKFIHGLHSIYTLYKSGIKTKKADYTLVQNDAYHLPFSFFDMVFLSDSAPLNEEIDHVIQHELKHVESRHTLDVLFIEIIQIFFWFHPMVYLYKSALRQTHEYIADQAVVGSGSRRAYSHLLVKQAMPGIQLALSHQFFQSHIKKRIDMMYQSKSTKMALIKYSVAIPVLALLIIVFSSQREAIAAETIEPLTSNELLKLDSDDHEAEVVEARLTQTNLPTYKEGDQALLMFLYKNITYPAYARKNGIQGQVQVTFSVDEQGYVGSISINEEIGGGCGQAAAEVINKMNMNGPSWMPALTNGKAVSAKVVLPVIFKLESDDSERIAEMETKKYKLPSNSLETIVVTAYAPKKTLEEGHKSQFPDSPNLEFIDGEVFKVVEQMPLFGGARTREQSDMELTDFIYSNLKYPKQALENKTSGRVYVQFIITEKGSMKQPKLIRSIPDGCGEAALDVVKLMMDQGRIWSPGLQRNTPVNVLYTLPIDFNPKDPSGQSITEKLEDADKARFNGPKDAIQRALQETFGDSVTGETKNVKSKIEQDKSPEIRTGIFNIPPNSLIVAAGNEKLKEGKDYEVNYQLGVIRILNERYLENKEAITVSFDADNDEKSSSVAQDTSKNPLVVIDGRKSLLDHKKATEFIEPNDIKSITVLKDENAEAAYPGYGSRGVIEITTKNPKKSNHLLGDVELDYNPVYIIDGETFFDISKSELEKIQPDDIIRINVYKGEAANKIQPDSGKRGLVRIITKNDENTLILNGSASISTNPIFIIDGEIHPDKSESYIQKLDPDDIKTINVYKDEAAEKLYPNSSERGIVKIITKNPKKTKKILAGKVSDDPVSLSVKASSSLNPIFIIDGVTYLDKSESYIDELESDDIKTINVYKGEAADKLYPDSGERGIIEIITKSPKGHDEKQQVIGKAEMADEAPDAFELSQNAPNPWKDITTFTLRLPQPATASIKVFDIAGREVYKHSEKFNAGENTFTIRKDDIGTSGIYYYEVKSGTFSKTRKMQLID